MTQPPTKRNNKLSLTHEKDGTWTIKADLRGLTDAQQSRIMDAIIPPKKIKTEEKP